MPSYDPTALTVQERYTLMIGAIVPRPIALVSTLSADGRPNLAPFSFFAGVSAMPMALVFCPANNADGGPKDTLRNALPRGEGGTGEFVVNVVSEAMAAKMAACAEPLAYGESEFALSGLTPAASERIGPPRVAESPVSFECRTERVIRLAPGAPSGGNLVIGEVVAVHAREGVVDARLHVNAGALEAIGRMGGRGYCRTTGEGQRFEMPMGREALGLATPG